MTFATYNSQCQDCRSQGQACTTHGGTTPSWVYDDDTPSDDTATDSTD